ncbi:hypothetical protein GH714_028923 [Hevea brasiliensis]|uniref:non-specific serine/threonine protein kinase n=1 Tax=Hevea brasiliensis TaxID=3981 RepID=A0A6A6LK16_HEVBR|nr:hypothetical protein GH714_028923 [Hevea brasiliensis]
MIYFAPIEFISIDCGSTSNYTDPRTGLEWISDNGIMNHGKPVEVKNPNGKWVAVSETQRLSYRQQEVLLQFKHQREKKVYCSCNIQYGRLENEDSFPKFELYLDATKWSTVTILDASRIYVEEMIIRAPRVLLMCASAVLQLVLPSFPLSSFGSEPFYGAPGTVGINTSKNIDIQTREYPPVKSICIFAEIEDLGANETRKFKLIMHPDMSDYSNAVVNIAENANGSYRLYEPSYMNVSLDFVLSFSFVKTRDSTQGPLLNAIEISKYLKIESKTESQDVAVLNFLRSMSAGSSWTNEGGDPCVPAQWEWVTCSSTSPPRITKIALSGKNLKGEIPSEINNMEELTELWLDGNSLTGPLPDISHLVKLKIVHLENNKLSGSLPKYLVSLPTLRALYIQNNSFSGKIPQALLTGKVIFSYENNPGLHKETAKRMHFKLILGTSISILAVLLVLLIGSLVHLRNLQKKTSHQKSNNHGVSYYISFSELEEATKNFSRKIGKGSFGTVYYGQMKDGKEVAVKIMADSSSHLTQQFVTEVALLSRIHHRNLVPLIGFCEEENQRILVYEYMHNGTLRDHVHGSVNQKRLDWLIRLQIAEDAAKGLEYLHTGCNPSIIHRDVKTSNILLDINMRAKVSDFGLSRQAEDDLTHISSVARGTVGYLDPEYYANQQLTEKSDVYSFGVVLLELITGKKPVSTEDFGSEMNIVHWARALIRKGDVVSIVDPVLIGNAKSNQSGGLLKLQSNVFNNVQFPGQRCRK